MGRSEARTDGTIVGNKHCAIKIKDLGLAIASLTSGWQKGRRD